MGFYWWYDRNRAYGSKLTGGFRGAEYIPVVEKIGFWRNFGWGVVGSLFWFAASIFILITGFGGWLNIGGTFYYGFIFAAITVSGLYPIHCWQQYRILQAASRDAEASIGESRETSPEHLR